MTGRGIELLRRHKNVNWAFADQSVISASNFFASVLIARFLGVQAFGWFCALLIVLRFMEAIQAALIVSPMLSIGAKQFGDDSRSYFTSVHLLQTLFGVTSVTLFALGSWLIGDHIAEWGQYSLTLPAAAAAFANQKQEYFRRCFFAQRRPGMALLTDGCGHGLRIAALYLILGHTQEPTLSSAVWIFAGTAGLAAVLSLILQWHWKWSSSDFKKIAARHWEFGKWLVGANALQFASRNAISFVIGGILGVAALGVFRATLNVVGFTNITDGALGNVIPIGASRNYQQHGAQGLDRYLRKAVLLSVGATATIAILACVAPEFWLSVFYGNKFNEYANLVYWHAACTTVTTFSSLPLQAGLKAMEQTQPIFLGRVFRLVLNVALAYPLGAWFGLPGVMFSILFAAVMECLILIVPLRRRLRTPDEASLLDRGETKLEIG